MPVTAKASAVVAAAVAAVGVGTAIAGTPRPVSVECRFDFGVTVVVEPGRNRIVVRDTGAGATSNRVVAIFTARGLVQHACRRVGQVHPRAFWAGHLFGVWPVRVPSRVACDFRGPRVRLDAYAMTGGGHRLTITRESRPGTYALFKAELRSRDRGGMWLELPLCRRTPPG